MKSTKMRLGIDRKNERSQDVVRLETALGWGMLKDDWQKQ
jgi:hypothetical protein